MEVTRLAVSVHPHPVLSLEFKRGAGLFVWRVELYNDGKSVDETVLELKRKFPRYLGNVSSVQLARLVKFATRLLPANLAIKSNTHSVEDLNKMTDEELTSKKSEMDTIFEVNQVKRSDPSFIYDYQIDFKSPKPRPMRSYNDSDSDEEFN